MACTMAATTGDAPGGIVTNTPGVNTMNRIEDVNSEYMFIYSCVKNFQVYTVFLV